MSKKKALVTGGAGFIGSHVADHLIKQGYEVVVLDDLSGGFLDNVPLGAEFVEGSITNDGLIKHLFAKEKFDYLFHFAAYAAEGLSHFIRRFNYETNLGATMNLINLSVIHKVKCFVFTSSIAVYGANQVPMREDMIPHPEDPYGISKYAVELDLEAAHKQFGLDYIIFRPHNVYGERQNIGDKYRNVIGIFMNKILLGEPLTIFGDGQQTRAFTYINDVAPMMAESIKNKKAYNQVFNIGGDHPYSVNELAVAVCKAFGVKKNIQYLKARNEVVNAYSDHSKINQYFKLAKSTDLDIGIKKMANWVKKIGSRKSKQFGNIEIPHGLPESW